MKHGISLQVRLETGLRGNKAFPRSFVCLIRDTPTERVSSTVV